MDVSTLVQSYRSFDPQGWVNLYRPLPTGVGIGFVVLGVGLLLFGNGRLFRLVAGPLGAVAGFLWVPVVVERFGLPGTRPGVAFVAGVALLLMGLLFPPGALFFLVGLPLGLVAGELAGPTDFLLGFLPAFLVAGALAATFHHALAGITSSLAGGWLVVIGALAALHQVGTVVAQVSKAPWGMVVAALLFAVTGSVYQVALKPSPEEAERLRTLRAREKRKQQEKQALEKRWSNHSSRKER